MAPRRLALQAPPPRRRLTRAAATRAGTRQARAAGSAAPTEQLRWFDAAASPTGSARSCRALVLRARNAVGSRPKWRLCALVAARSDEIGAAICSRSLRARALTRRAADSLPAGPSALAADSTAQRLWLRVAAARRRRDQWAKPRARCALTAFNTPPPGQLRLLRLGEARDAAGLDLDQHSPSPAWRASNERQGAEGPPSRPRLSRRRPELLAACRSASPSGASSARRHVGDLRWRSRSARRLTGQAAAWTP